MTFSMASEQTAQKSLVRVNMMQFWDERYSPSAM
jgi:hypothetical protein